LPQTITVPNKAGVVIGIDVGGPSKGFHAVALRDGRYLAKYASSDPLSIAAWCRETGALIVGIDAPCRWSSAGRARSAERALAAERISAFATPDIEKAKCSSFYRWMLNGAELYRSIEPDYPLMKGSNTISGRGCFETFPQAVACALAGKIVSAKRKAVERRVLLRKAGIDISALTNIDTVDAALCALAAHYFLAGSVKAYGDAKDGFIVVPAL
jgi:predicted nuclease with RNAse H fold